MREQKAYQVVQRGFNRYFKGSGTVSLYKHLLDRKTVSALEAMFKHTSKLELKADKNLLRAKLFGVTVPNFCEYPHNFSLDEMLDEFGVVAKDNLELFSWVNQRIDYLSDRWVAPSRIAFYLWVSRNFTVDDLVYLSTCEYVDRETKTDIASLGYYVEGTDNLSDVNEESNIKKYRATFKNQFKMRKLKAHINGDVLLDSGIWVSDVRSSKHIRTDSVQGLMMFHTPVDKTFESRGLTILSLKHGYYADRGTSRYRRGAEK